MLIKEGGNIKKIKIFLIIGVFILVSALKLFAEQNRDYEIFKLSLPEKDWALEVGIQGFVVKESMLYSGGEARSLLASNDTTGITMSIFLEKTPKKGDSKACRKYYWAKAKKSLLKKDNIRMRETEQMAIVEFLVKEHAGVQLNQKNLNAYLVKDDIWIDIHLSKVYFKPEEEELFNAVLKTVNFNDNYNPKSFWEYFGYGSFFYIEEDFVKAAKYYQKALDLENEVPELDTKLWRVLIDNLGMAYGISGDAKRAKAIFENAIEQDSSYPIFYYNLACAYAEMDDMENAIINLQAAFKRKKNMTPEEQEKMPNPKTDSSFHRFLNNKDFIKAIEQLEIRD